MSKSNIAEETQSQRFRSISNPELVFYLSNKLMEEKYIMEKIKKNLRRRRNFNCASIQNDVGRENAKSMR